MNKICQEISSSSFTPAEVRKGGREEVFIPANLSRAKYRKIHQSINEEKKT